MSTSRKIVVAVAAGGGIVIAICVILYFASPWLMDVALGARKEKEPVAEEKKKPPEKPAPVKVKAKEYAHDQAAEVEGIKIELLRGSVGKLDQMFFGAATKSKEEHYRIDFRLTNNADNFVLTYIGWHGDFPFPELVDESGNRYSYASVLDTSSLEKRTLAKGQSLEHAVAFALPREDAKEFRLEMNCNMIRKDNEHIAFKIPRAFFKGK